MRRTRIFWRHIILSILFILTLLEPGTPKLKAEIQASESRYTIASVPTWVEDVKATLTTPTRSVATDDDIRVLLFDKQINVDTEERFIHVARAVLNESGVQNGSQLSFEFDPAFQKLTIHRARILRGTNALDRLDEKKIKVIQQEKDLDWHLYDGTLSALLFLEDVRVGDIVEYAYTIRGFNPVFEGRYTESFLTQWSAPLDLFQIRVLASVRHSLVIKNYKTEIQPIINNKGEHREYIWKNNNQHALREEDSLPAWFDPYPQVQITEFATWADVANWANRIYGTPVELGEDLRAKVEQWRTATTEPEKQLLLALQCVQDEVRYLGIELGTGSHAPTDPNVVFSRRFGDCKDKTLLLCTLLKQLGIDAAPALVNTSARQTIDDHAPSPGAFNHVVTQVKIGERLFWVDPTRSDQRGPLSARYFPDFRRALVVRPGITNLTVIARQTNGLPKTTITEKFTVKGRKQPAEFTVTTVAEGLDAEKLRGDLASATQEQLQKNYLNFYARDYPTIESVKSLEVHDDLENNVIQTTEHYRIQEFWTLSKDKKYFEGEFYPRTIVSLLERPNTRLRTMPLGIAHPRHDILRTEVSLPEEWTVDNEEQMIVDSAFKLTASKKYKKRKLVMQYEYESLGDVVDTKHVPEHLKNIDRAFDELGYTLTWAREDVPAAAWKPNWMLFALAGFYMMPLLLGVVFIYRLRGDPNVPPYIDGAPDERLKGIGGWLAFIALGLIASPIRIGFDLYKGRVLYSLDFWNTATAADGASYSPYWGPLLVFTLLGNLTLLTFSVLMLVFFFQKRRHFPRLFICFLLGTAVLQIFDQVGSSIVSDESVFSDPKELRPVIRSLSACAIWIPYMLKSRRVKLTFIR